MDTAENKAEKDSTNEPTNDLEAIEKTIELKPDDASNWHWKGITLGNLKRYPEALVAFEKTIELKPDDDSYWRWKGITLRDLKRYPEALVVFEKTIELKPDDAYNWHWKGITLRDLERYPEALEAFEKTIALAPANVINWWYKGITLGNPKRYPEALEAFEKTIALAPANVINWRGKAEILCYLQRLDEALISLEKAIGLDPQNAFSYNMKGVILMKGTRYDEALSHFDSALQRQINHLYLFNRGTALIRLQRFEEAEDSIRRARELVASSQSETDQQAKKQYDEALVKLAGRKISWWSWWFGETTKPRRALGVFLVFIILVSLIAPFIRNGTLGWFNSGQDWATYIVPTAISTLLLILPVIRSFGAQGIDVMPMLGRPEIDVRELTKISEPRIRLG